MVKCQPNRRRVGLFFNCCRKVQQPDVIRLPEPIAFYEALRISAVDRAHPQASTSSRVVMSRRRVSVMCQRPWKVGPSNPSALACDARGLTTSTTAIILKHRTRSVARDVPRNHCPRHPCFGPPPASNHPISGFDGCRLSCKSNASLLASAVNLAERR